ncbi:hypothetical protein [Okeania sp. KiyG1]|uniref:fascin domain-containing protein n=1 Tax=Okeania sp. KiyG1 TaxID=2720165 RepID=UPI00192397DC|nr:hypothetical protein [Okeania sp. KiyG1]GGA33713.1 hypothetical protein CYANOKiyG1_50820 [Okeania sp. KiyG1]
MLKKKWFTLTLTLAAIGPLTLTETLAQSQDKSFPRGKVALQVADQGTFMDRCRDCQSTVVPIPDTVTLRDEYNVGHAHFTVVPVSGGKIALKADIGQYVARFDYSPEVSHGDSKQILRNRINPCCFVFS